MKGAVFCVFFCAFLAIVVADDPVGICGLPGFDLNDLHLGRYWEFTVTNPGANCLHIYNDTEIESCKVYFSICKPLPQDICGGINNVSYCQVVTNKNGTKSYFVIGNYSLSHNFNAGVGGFSAIRNGYTYSNEQECPRTLITTINFECDGSAKYDSNVPDVSRYVITTKRLGCFNVYNLKYSGGCYIQPTLAPSHCSLTGYNMTAISTKDYFTAEVRNSLCIDFTGPCILLMAFCHPLPFNIAENCSNPESAVCQANKVTSATEAWSMGAYDNFTSFVDDNGKDEFGFAVSYTGGSKPSSKSGCKNGIKTNIVFLCDENAPWTTTDVTFYTKTFFNDTLCTYDIVALYDGACYRPPNGSGNQAKTSIIGWVFIGIFMFGVLTYLVVGAAFQFFVRKERGLKVIPNYDFWKGFLLLTLEGCKFSLDVITCHRFDGSPQGGGTKYDQL